MNCLSVLERFPYSTEMFLQPKRQKQQGIRKKQKRNKIKLYCGATATVTATMATNATGYKTENKQLLFLFTKFGQICENSYFVKTTFAISLRCIWGMESSVWRAYERFAALNPIARTALLSSPFKMISVFIQIIDTNNGSQIVLKKPVCNFKWFYLMTVFNIIWFIFNTVAFILLYKCGICL